MTERAGISCRHTVGAAVLPHVYHLLDAVEALAVEAEGLFEQHLVLHCPLVRERGEVGQVGQRLLDVVFVPEQHAESLDRQTQP